MKVRVGYHFLSFGAFPVLAAAAFQVCIIIQASDSLARFFVFQSVVAIGLSLACLQPRTWSSNLRTAGRLRWSLIFSLGFLAAAAAYCSVFPSALGFIAGAFLAKKTCDVAREFIFLASVPIPRLVVLIVTALEVVGIGLLILGFVAASAIAYALSGLILVGYALFSVRGESWSVGWAVKELPHAGSMTLFNMGSRIFLVSVSSPAAHLTIGSILQVVNFLSPVTFSVYSRVRSLVVYSLAWLFCASAIVAGSQVFILLGGGGAGVWYTAAFAGFLAFNSSSVIRVSAVARPKARTILGAAVSCWVAVGALIGFSGILSWENSFLVYLAGMSVLLVIFAFLQRERVQS